MSVGRLLEVAAAIADPWGERPLPAADAIDYPAVAELLVANKASFLTMHRRYGAALDMSPLAPWLEAERARFHAIRREFERVRLDLEAHGVRTVLFKSTGLFPSFPFLSSNLDVLIDPGKGDLARRRLHALGYTELLNVEEPDKYLFRRFPLDGTLDTFHLHEAVGWGVPFVDVEDIWAGARPAQDDPEILVPAPREALLITTAHWFYEDKELSLQNLFFVADALRKLDVTLDSVAEAAALRGWSDGFFAGLQVFDDAWRLLFGASALSERDRELVSSRLRRVGHGMRAALGSVSFGGSRPATVPFLRNKVIYYEKIMRDPARPVGRRLFDVGRTLLWAVRWKLHLRPQKPMLVTVSGCDGSGKTLQVERLREVLRTCDIRVETVWSRGASSRGMGWLIRVAKRVFGVKEPAAGAAADEPGEAARIAQRRRALSGPLRRRLFAFFLGLELAFVYAVRVRWLLLRGNVVICDRYVYDAAVDVAVAAAIDGREARDLLAGLFAVCPKPDLAFLLDVTEEDALRRKPDEGDVAHLAEGRRAFHALAHACGLRTVDAHATIDEVYEKLHRESLNLFYGRYRTVLNWLLASDPAQLNPGKWRA